MENTSLDMRSVTQLITNQTDTNYSQLNKANEADREVEYLNEIASTLAGCEYLDTVNIGSI